MSHSGYGHRKPFGSRFSTVALITATLLTLGLCVLADDSSAASPDPAVAAMLQPYIDRRQTAGVVAVVASRERILSVTPVGYEDLAASKPMAANSLFWIASITKSVTAVAVMMLVEEGKISLDDPVAKYLPEFQNMMVAPPLGSTQPVPAQSPILVRQLLDHTSGLGFRTAIEKPALDDLPLAQSVPSYAKSLLRFQPGTGEFYSNEGFNTAGRLVEIVSGEAYEKFLAERIFQPLGMTDTTFWPSDEQLTRLAKTYAPVVVNGVSTLVEKPFTDQLTYPLNDRQHRYPFPAGGLFASGPDIARFGQMLANGGTCEGKYYLSPASIAEMSRDQTGSLARRVGLGFEDIAPDRYGKGCASNTRLTIYPGPGLVAVFFPQQNGAFPGGMRGDFEKLALQELRGDR